MLWKIYEQLRLWHYPFLEDQQSVPRDILSKNMEVK